MRRIAIINQKGGVGKTTTAVNLGAALAIQGRRVVVVDMDAQANLSMALGIEAPIGSPTSYSILLGEKGFGACLRPTKIPNLSLIASNIDLSGAELELASAMGREYLLRDALREWDEEHRQKKHQRACDYVLFDCPPSLGLLSINALAAAGEVLITLQTEFFALQGMSKLIEIVQLLKKRLNPELVVTGIVPSLYDSRLKLAREVLGEIRSYFKGQVLPQPIRANVKLAEAPSFGQTIFEYAPDSNGASDYMKLAREILARESRDPELASLPPFDPEARLPVAPSALATPPRRVPPPPRRKSVDVIVPAVAAPKPPDTRAVARAPLTPPEPQARPPVTPPATHTAPQRTAPPPTTTTPPRKKSIARVAPAVAAPQTATQRPAARTAIQPPNPQARPPIVPTAPSAAPKRAAPPRQKAPDVSAPAAAAKKPAETHPKSSQESRRPAPAARVETKSAPRPSTRVLRADDMPPLPPDAFEILSSPFDA